MEQQNSRPAHTMPLEIEAKFYPVEKDAIRKKLCEVGAICTLPEILMKRVVYDKRMNPQVQGSYVRLRDEGKTVRLSVKQNAMATGTVTDQREMGIIVKNFDATRSLLALVGLQETGYQENYRETWQLQSNEIVIDTWPGLLPYIEIESPTEVDLKHTADLLGCNWEEKIITSNDEIYARVYNLSKQKALELMRHCTFQENPFSVSKG